MKVYIVTKGEYSDYHIEGVFSTKKLAEYYAKIVSDKFFGKAYVEEWEVNTHKPKIYGYRAKIGQEGNIEIEKIEPTMENCRKEINGSYFANGATPEEAKKNAIDYRAKQSALKAEEGKG